MTSTLTILTHDMCHQHDMGEGHPESPQRLEVLQSIFESYEVFQATQAKEEQLLLAHRFEYIEMLRQASPKKDLIMIDGDTVMCPETYDAALYAAGAGCQAVDLLMKNQVMRVFCATRPPGHHAEPDKACGFCFFCNPFIAARYVQNAYGIGRVAIIDFDVHHGNGTAACVRDQAREDIMYASAHQSPLFPGTGTGDLELEDDLDGLIMDVPLPRGTGSKEWRMAYENGIFPQITSFDPELIILSAGFDAHKDDPLAGFELDEKDFAWVTKQIVELANLHSNGHIISFLEGGYDLEALKNSVSEHLKALNV